MTEPLPERFEFASFELDLGRRELRCHGEVVPVQSKVIDLLAHLIRHRDRVVTRDELLRALWPEVVVTEPC